MLPDTPHRHSGRNYIRLTWENHGVAPAYYRYKLSVKLVHKESGKFYTRQLAESDNRNWQPFEIVAEHCSLKLDKSITQGSYDLLINLRDECGFHNRDIELAMKAERETEPGWYKLGEVIVR